MKSKIYLTGGWGYGNKGDNAIFEAMMQSFSEANPRLEIVVTSYSPSETLRQHGIDSMPSIHRYMRSRHPLSWLRWLCVALWRFTNYKLMLSSTLRRHISAIEKSDAVVFGGGGYFNDAWVDMLWVKYLEIEIAKAKNKPMIFYGQTIGPFAGKTIKNSLSTALKSVSHIAYRDIQSRGVLEKAGVSESKSTFTADEANLLARRQWERPPALRDAGILMGVMIQGLRAHLGAHGPSTSGRVRTTQQYVQSIVIALKNFHKECPTAGFIFIPSTTWDQKLCRKVYMGLKEMGVERVHFLADPHVNEFIGSCQNVDVMLSTNMHPIILAATSGIPSIALSYHYKLDDYMATIGLGKFVLRIDDFDSDFLYGSIKNCIDQRKALSEEVSLRHSAVREKATLNFKLLHEVLDERPTQRAPCLSARKNRMLTNASN